MDSRYIIFFDALTSRDAEKVGGKLRVLGELIQRAQELGIAVPNGFSVTTDAYREHLKVHNLTDEIYIQAEHARKDPAQRNVIAEQIREKIIAQPLAQTIRDAIVQAYHDLGPSTGSGRAVVAVRSSATAEDLPTASFAGQQDTYLNIVGADAVCDAVRKCWASLFTERALTYRAEQNIPEKDVAIAVGVQRMVDVRSAGVFFTLEPTTGNRDFVSIESALGVGEALVQGLVRPDTVLVHKKTSAAPSQGIITMERGSSKEPSLARAEAAEIAQAAMRLEAVYGYALDGEWAIDKKGKLFIVQARPETVFAQKKILNVERFIIHGVLPEPLCSGVAVGRTYATGRVRVIADASQAGDIDSRDIIVTRMTQPDWLPILKRAAGIITDEGGRTCHAAIVSRELKIPALVGTGDATKRLRNGDTITLIAEGGLTGAVYPGTLDVERQKIAVGAVPKEYPPLMLIVGDPERSLESAQLPVAGVGLARMEFIIATRLKIHPCAAVDDDRSVCDASWKPWLDQSATLAEAYTLRLATEIALLAAPFYPRPVIVRFGDFKSNEYRRLSGGKKYEPVEENPMIGLRGAAGYLTAPFREAFYLECAAIKRVREWYGLSNVQVMVPFVRTIEEAREVIALLDAESISKKSGIERWMMVEIPSNVLLLDQFAALFDGFSIGSNDLTQLTLGVDRDSGVLSGKYDERNPAVTKLITQAIICAQKCSKPIGICGQAPSDYPEIRQLLIDSGVSSMSLTQDAVSDLLALEQ